VSAKANYSKTGAFILSTVVTAVIAIVMLSGGKWFTKVNYVGKPLR
jgi:hypothetical protein